MLGEHGRTLTAQQSGCRVGGESGAVGWGLEYRGPRTDLCTLQPLAITLAWPCPLKRLQQQLATSVEREVGRPWLSRILMRHRAVTVLDVRVR